MIFGKMKIARAACPVIPRLQGCRAPRGAGDRGERFLLYAPMMEPCTTVPFFSSMVHVSLLSFCRKRTSFIVGFFSPPFALFHTPYYRGSHSAQRRQPRGRVCPFFRPARDDFHLSSPSRSLLVVVAGCVLTGERWRRLHTQATLLAGA